MKTVIQSIHFKADPKLKDFIKSKMEKLNKFYDGNMDSQVYLKVENSSLKDNKTIEIKLNVQNQSLMKTQTSQSFEAATDLAVEALKTQLKRYKEKMQTTA